MAFDTEAARADIAKSSDDYAFWRQTLASRLLEACYEIDKLRAEIEKLAPTAAGRAPCAGEDNPPVPNSHAVGAIDRLFCVPHRVAYLLRHIEDQADKRQWLNALCWTNDLSKLCLELFNDVLKGRDLGSGEPDSACTAGLRAEAEESECSGTEDATVPQRTGLADLNTAAAAESPTREEGIPALAVCGDHSPDAAAHSITIVFVINGEDVEFDANAQAPLRQAVAGALVKSRNIGRDFRQWEVRSADGVLLETHRTPVDAGFSDGVRIFVSLSAGAGGINAPSHLSPQRQHRGNSNDCVWDAVIADMRERDAQGLAKYGVRLHPHNGRRPLVDAYQEVLDLVVYMKQELMERECYLAKAPIDKGRPPPCTPRRCTKCGMIRYSESCPYSYEQCECG